MLHKVGGFLCRESLQQAFRHEGNRERLLALHLALLHRHGLSRCVLEHDDVAFALHDVFAALMATARSPSPRSSFRVRFNAPRASVASSGCGLSGAMLRTQLASNCNPSTSTSRAPIIGMWPAPLFAMRCNSTLLP